MATIKESLDISKLMSPPDPDTIDSFSKPNSNGSATRIIAFSPTQVCSEAQTLTTGNGSKMLKGEMISPVSLGGDEVGLEDTGSAQDPILFPDSTPSLNSRPLFAGDEAAIISNHIAARPPALFRQVSPPRGEDYELVVRMQSQVMQRFTADRQGWLAQQREQLRADNRAAAEWRKRLQLPAPASRPAFSQPAPRNLTPRAPKVQAMMQAVQTSPSHHNQPAFSRPVHDITKRVAKRAGRAPGVPRNSLPARIAPQVNGSLRHGPSNSQSTSRVPGSSPEPRVRNSAPNREDKDFKSLPDYCPPTSTLPERTNLLKVEWKGAPLDLSHDPFRNLLHPDELGLAAGLRLDCATYLTSKRRIFIRRLECARLPKEFRKTDAQQACKIDVNKASKLWSAYDKVGWLHMEHIRKFL
ncbi:hypothetical protein SCUCBS95973_006177 [Sporothrix curviconia]|uniref:SWIRM domain-containing protein n=1 Tax=Sporothrix curviconia TaxID=1260050 RepID=A0ABP0C315_9PEZI